MSGRKDDQQNKLSRKPRGEGSVFKRKDGRFQVKIPLGSGKYKSGYFETQKEAERTRRQWLHELEQGKLVTAKDQPLQDYLEYWLKVKKMTVRETTIAMYHRYLSDYVYPSLGNIKLQKLSGEMIQQLYSELLDDEVLSGNSIRLLHRILSTAMNAAVKLKKLSFSPVKDVTVPRAVRRDMRVLTIEQARTLIHSIDNERFKCLLTLAVVTGMRRGEMLALRWSDIDFQKAEVNVKRSLSFFYNPVEDVTLFYEGPPKTTASKRMVMLPTIVLNALKMWKEEQNIWKKNAHSWEHDDLVFSTRKGTFWSPNNVTLEFKAVLRAAGLPHMRIHDLRHSAATILLEMGVHVKMVQELLGHEDIKTTLGIYGHLLEGTYRDAMNQLDERYRDEEGE